jgi:DNA polymerase-3 subunit beta
MKVIIPRLELIALIGKIQNIVPSKPSLPILSNVLVEAMDDQIVISATDLNLSMRAYGPAKVQENGSITLPARKLFQLIREFTAPQVEIHTLSDEIATINAGSSHFKIHGMHKSEFTALPELLDNAQFSIPSALLKELLCRTAFAAARDDSRQPLSGILLQNANKTATFISTDGKRLAKIHSAIDLPSECNGSYIIPLKTVEEMIRMLDAREEELAKITLMADKISLELKSATLISKLLSGQFPDLSGIIPQQKEPALSLHREELMNLLRQVSLFTSEDSSSVKFSFTTGELHLSITSKEIGEGIVKMPVNYAGEKLEIAFNPSYFLDILRNSKDETVKFNVTNSYNPGLITDSSTAQFVIMPMRLD